MSAILKNKNPSTALKNEVVKIKQLRAIIENDERFYDENGLVDEKLILDTIEGETNIHEMILELDDHIAEFESKSISVKIRIEDMQKRKNRIDKTIETLRTIILSAMDKAGIDKIESDISTISIKKKPPALVIIDESLLPSMYIKMEPKVDKKKITQDLKDKKQIQGAELDNGGISLQIRRS